MLKSNILKKRSIFRFYFEKLNLFRALFVFFTFGFVVGVFLIDVQGELFGQKIGYSVDSFILSRTNKSFCYIFFNSFFNFIVLFLILFFVGFFPFGQLFSFFVPMFHGMGLGLFSSYLYYTKGVNGVIFCLLFVAPCEIIYSLTIMLAAKTSVRFSNRNFKLIFLKKHCIEEPKGEFKLYLLRYAVLLLFLIIATFLTTLSNFIFPDILG